MLVQLSRPQGFALLVDPPPQREVLRDPHFELDVVGHGVDAGDLVLGPPPQQRLVALEPHQRLRPVDAGAQERSDRRGVARGGEVEKCGLDGCIGAALLLLAAVVGLTADAAGSDDPAVLVALEVDVALPVGEGAGGELLDESFRVRTQALEDGDEGLVAGGGDHVLGVLARLEEHRHDDPGDLRAAIPVRAQRPSDVLHDLDLGATGVREADRIDPALAGDVYPLPENAYGGEERPVYAPVVGVDAVGELAEGFAALGDEVVAAQPLRPDAVRGYVAAGLQLVELGVDW